MVHLNPDSPVGRWKWNVGSWVEKDRRRPGRVVFKVFRNQKSVCGFNEWNSNDWGNLNLYMAHFTDMLVQVAK